MTTASNQPCLARVLAAASLMSEELSPEVTINQVLMFLHVAQAVRIDQGEAGRACNMSSAGNSRNAAALAAKGPFVPKEGYGVLRITQDPTDRRRRILMLTPKGRRLITTLETLVSEHPAPIAA